MTSISPHPPGHGSRAFDLNVEAVLDHWTSADAVREFIANALDEATLSGTECPTITRLRPGSWEIRDRGRGLRYEHLTQNEDQEKRRNPDRVIGRFGVGLKDALAVLHRHRVRVALSSRHGLITLAAREKAGFDDVVTLHAQIAPPADPQMIGTCIALHDVPDHEVERAIAFFRAYSGEQTLEATPFGEILERRANSPARIYVNGMVVAEEENFAFSYNVTRLTEAMRKALNRERMHVGRSAYRERVKDMLLAAASPAVGRALCDDLARIASGESYDETMWVDVQVHAAKLLSAAGDVVFVTATEHLERRAYVDYAREQGRTIITIPEAVGRHLHSASDIAGAPIASLTQFLTEWRRRFSYEYIAESELTDAERAIFAGHRKLLEIARATHLVRSVRVSRTIQPSPLGGDDARGVWVDGESAIILRRDALKSHESFAAVLLHEIGHAVSGASDVTIDFERGLTEILGRVGAAAVASDHQPSWPAPRATSSGSSAVSPSKATDRDIATPGTSGFAMAADPSSPAPGSDGRHALAGATLTGSGAPPQNWDPPLATTLEGLIALYPWARFEQVDGRNIYPRVPSLESDASFQESRRRDAACPEAWDARLRAEGVSPDVHDNAAAYQGLRVVRGLIGVPGTNFVSAVTKSSWPFEARAAASRNPGDPPPCENAEGVYGVRGCGGRPATDRLRMDAPGARRKGARILLCGRCADAVEQLATSRFRMVERREWEPS